MKFGVRNTTLKQSWEETFGEAAWLGFDGVELEIKVPLEATLLGSEEGRRRLRQLQAGSGMDLAAFSLGPLAAGSSLARDAGPMEDTVDLVRRCIQWARIVDCSLLLLPLPFLSYGPQDETPRARWIETLRRCAPTAESEGICLALGIGRAGSEAALALLKMAEMLDSRWVKIFYRLDIAPEPGRDLAEEIRLLGSRLCHLQIGNTSLITPSPGRDTSAERKPQGPGIDLLASGSGSLTAAAAALQQVGYSSYLTLDLEVELKPAQAAAQALHSLQEVFT